MIDGLERGHMLLGGLLVFSLAAGVLFFMQQTLRHSMIQERGVVQALVHAEALDAEVAEMKLALERGEDDRIQWLGDEDDESCRVFGNKYRYLQLSQGWYGERLAQWCYPESGYEGLGIYYVNGAGLAEERVRYAYLRRDLNLNGYREISGWQSRIVDGEISVEIVESGRSYVYQLPRSFQEAPIDVFRSVTKSGFYLLYQQELWLLPKDGESLGKVVEDVVVNGVIVADFVGDDGVYILSLQESCGRAGCFYMTFYPKLSNKEELLSSVLVEQEVVWDNYRVLLVDELKVVVEIDVDSELQLLAVMWDGSAVWGESYLWSSQEKVFCPLQSQPFEPINGWVLGCERSFL